MQAYPTIVHEYSFFYKTFYLQFKSYKRIFYWKLIDCPFYEDLTVSNFSFYNELLLLTIYYFPYRNLDEKSLFAYVMYLYIFKMSE